MEIEKQDKALEFLSGGGEMGERIRLYNWESTSLGHPSQWPQNLKTCVRIMLTSRQPIWIGWGQDLIKLYNDPYIYIVGGKHPHSLGQPAREVWKELWHQIQPMLQQVMQENTGTYVESQPLIMVRNGYPEETFYTFSYTPIPGDDGNTAGMICFNTDDTERIVGERQLRTLKDLASNKLEEKNEAEIFQETVNALGKNPHDFPFAMIYEIMEGSTEIKLCGSTFANFSGADNVPEKLDYAQNTGRMAAIVKEAIATRGNIMAEDPKSIFRAVPKSVWNKETDQVLFMPLMHPGQEKPYALLISGLNPYRLPNEKYLHFFRLVTDHINISINNIRAFEVEKKRARALEELDRAKTAFFNNISHEFRTPLALMLGPLEELIEAQLPEKERENVETAHRNARRLLRLVNTLLDFSRIESGRMDASFTAVDICRFTEQLAGNFRSMVEKAGLKFHVSCPHQGIEVYLDKNMWEKIVLNLLSNAFKYTLSGGISVKIALESDHVSFAVADTGAGIPENEIPHMFERFHRIKNSHGRSFEGTGIGLSLVYELVKLHGGAITVESVAGMGSRFTVNIPLGKRHLPADQVAGTGTGMSPNNHQPVFFDDEMKLPSYADTLTDMAGENNSTGKPKVLIVDDNADMRAHISNLLRKDYTLHIATNGLDALDKIKQHKPDLVLSDIMMPQMDGLEMLKHIKVNPETGGTPVILISARAGEEARAEGYDEGADDYLVKPFTAKELKARVRGQLMLLHKRRRIDNQLKTLFEQAPVAVSIFTGPSFIIDLANMQMLRLWNKKAEDVMHKPALEAIPNMLGLASEDVLKKVWKNKERYSSDEIAIETGTEGENNVTYIKYVLEPLHDDAEEITGIVAIGIDITDLELSRRKAQDSEGLMRLAITATGIGTWGFIPENGKVDWSPECRNIYGLPDGVEINSELAQRLVHQEDIENAIYAVLHSLDPAGSGGCDVTYRINRYDNNEMRWVRTKGKTFFSAEGVPLRFVGTIADITDQRNFEEMLVTNEQRARMAIETAALGTFEWNLKNQDFLYSGRMAEIFGYEKNDIITHDTLMNSIHHDDRHLRDRAIEEAMLTGNLNYEIRVLWPDKSIHWVRINGRVLYDNDETPLKMLGTAMDITEQKMQSEYLERKVAERTAELKETIDDLARSNNDLEQFAYVASHDLKEPIRMVSAYTALLNDRFRELMPAEGKEFMGYVIDGTTRMQQLIGDLLQYSRIGNQKTIAGLVDINNILSAVTQNLHEIIEKNEAVINYSNLPEINGVETQLIQLFQNLLGNAIKFRSQAVPVIDITAENHGKFWQFCVKDNGIGISHEYYEKIFVIFQRLHTREKYEGTGIGLSVCKKIIELHGGRIWVTSTPSEGTCFYFTMPIQANTPGAE